MPNLPFISAPELGPKEDLLVQAGLSGAPQHLPLKNNFYYDNHLQGDFFNWASPENVSRLAPPKFAWSGPP